MSNLNLSLDPTLSYCHGFEDGKANRPIRGSSPEYEDGHLAGWREHPIGRVKAQIHDVKEELEWGCGSDKETEETEKSLRRLQEQLAEMELDASRDGQPFSVARLNEMESEQRCFESHIAKLAKEIAQFRGEPVRDGHTFDNYERFTADGWAIKDWPIGTRLISAYFTQWYSGDCSTETVRFPEEYLEIDWKPLEREKLNAKLAAQAEVTKKATADKETRERAQYERLRAKYGEQ